MIDIYENIAQKIKEGDEKAFEVVFRKHYSGMCGYVSRYIDDPDQAEEIVQEVFYNFWNKRTDIHITGSLESYLFRSARNSSLNYIKHLKVRHEYVMAREVLLKEEESRTTDEIVELELHQKIDECIEQLPAERQRIFKMSRFDGLKNKEIAEKLDISIKTVEAQMGKALKYLRENLVDYLPVMLFWMTQILG